MLASTTRRADPRSPAGRPRRRRRPRGSPERAAARMGRGTRRTPRSARPEARWPSSLSPRTGRAPRPPGARGRDRARRPAASSPRSRRRLHVHASAPTTTMPRPSAASGRSQASRSKPRFGGSASTAGPNWSTRLALICAALSPAAIRARMNAFIRVAIGSSTDRASSCRSGRRSPPRDRPAVAGSRLWQTRESRAGERERCEAGREEPDHCAWPSAA